MSWQVKFALNYLNDGSRGVSAVPLHGELISISMPAMPDVNAIILADKNIDLELVMQKHREEAEINFICGFKKDCVWAGPAIAYLEECEIGWGSIGTLSSAVLDGNVNTAVHKVYKFSDRLLKQYFFVKSIRREYDRLYELDLKNNRTIRLAMLAEYEPTADAVRSCWQQFGPVDLLWNINPNGSPTQSAIQAADELGCKVLKWEDLKSFMRA